MIVPAWSLYAKVFEAFYFDSDSRSCNGFFCGLPPFFVCSTDHVTLHASAWSHSAECGSQETCSIRSGEWCWGRSSSRTEKSAVGGAHLQVNEPLLPQSIAADIAVCDAGGAVRLGRQDATSTHASCSHYIATSPSPFLTAGSCSLSCPPARAARLQLADVVVFLHAEGFSWAGPSAHPTTPISEKSTVSSQLPGVC